MGVHTTAEAKAHILNLMLENRDPAGIDKLADAYDSLVRAEMQEINNLNALKYQFNPSTVTVSGSAFNNQV